MTRFDWKKSLSLLILIMMMTGLLCGVEITAEESSGSELFKFGWDQDFGFYCVASDEVFPLTVHVVSLPDVGNYRLSNHSDVVAGVRQAVAITLRDEQVKELVLGLGDDLYAKLNVNISCIMVEDWDVYRTLLESANSTIIVNTHDEYLPVPEGYTKEGWADMIADFMLNRWGTWVHAGGYPMYRVWHQNGTIIEWGEQGFKHLMIHMNKSIVDCQPPPGSENEKASEDGGTSSMGTEWLWSSGKSSCSILSTFAHSDIGMPLKFDDFRNHVTMDLFSRGYENRTYLPGAVIRFRLNESAFNFGVYVHMGCWRFYDSSGNPVRNDYGKLFHDFATSFISTAAAICHEFFYATSRLYSRFYQHSGNGALEAIQKAEKEGRTVGLNEARSLFQKSLDSFASANYKASAAYALQSSKVAEEAAVPSTLPQTIAAVGTVAALIIVGVVLHRRINKKKTGKREKTYVNIPKHYERLW